MFMRWLAAFIFVFLGLFLFPIFADAGQGQLQEVSAVEAYINDISTLRARFVQTTSDGKQVGGTFLLKRPGRMPSEYAPPLTDFIVADGLFIYYYDGQMKQQSNVLISKSLASFFLRSDLKFSGDISVSDIKRNDGLLLVTLVQSEDSLEGSLTLMVAENPMQLKKWIVVDAQGLVTKVELFDIESGVKLDDDLFYYYDPERKKPSYN